MAEQKPGFLLSSYPVSFPSHDALTMSESQFQSFLKESLATQDPTSFSLTLLQRCLGDLAVENTITGKHEAGQEELAKQNKMFTSNHDVAYRSTTNPLVNLFFELENVVSGVRLHKLLAAAWDEDPLMTLKIIFNARSIHIGKSSRSTFYRCAGWLAMHHPLTLLFNLQWLVRPIINKKAVKEGANEAGDADTLVIVEAEKDEEDASRFDVKHGVAHGYYKDLLNILVLAVNDKLDVLNDPHVTLNVVNRTKKGHKITASEARAKRQHEWVIGHSTAVTRFNNSAFYSALHVVVARIFAIELSRDLLLLSSADPEKMKQISLCAKWAPSHKLFHDKHTFVVSSIAEILHPHTSYAEMQDREIYLRHAREAYRKDIASLRKALDVVERKISAKALSEINYESVPSLAMNRYASLFIQKDTERFDRYIGNVAQGTQAISGAVLLPSTIIHTAMAAQPSTTVPVGRRKTASAIAKGKSEAIRVKAVDGQLESFSTTHSGLGHHVIITCCL